MSAEKYPGFKFLSAQLPIWKQELSWLRDANSQSLQQALRNLDQAFNYWFKSPDVFSRPTFRKRFRNDAFRICGEDAGKTRHNQIWLRHFGWMSFRSSRPWQGVVKSMSISRVAEKWYVTLKCHQNVKQPTIRTDPWIGIDVGIAQYATLSTGAVYDGIHALESSKNRLAKLQRHLSRQKPKSNKWLKTKSRIAKLHNHIANKRHDHAQKLSTILVKNHGRVKMEDLRISKMINSKSKKGSLNRRFADQGLRQFRNFIEYKLDWSGGTFEAVNPSYTSQKCHTCGYIFAGNRRKNKFQCKKCGHKDHADINAAKNI